MVCVSRGRKRAWYSSHGRIWQKHDCLFSFGENLATSSLPSQRRLEKSSCRLTKETEGFLWTSSHHFSTTVWYVLLTDLWKIKKLQSGPSWFVDRLRWIVLAISSPQYRSTRVFCLSFASRSCLFDSNSSTGSLGPVFFVLNGRKH